MAALFSHSTVIINSVAGPGIDLTLATRSIAPTVTVISAETAVKLHSTTTQTITSGLKKLAHYLETRVLTSGRLPTDTFFSRLNAPTRASVGTTPGKLRLVFVAERAGQNTPPLSSADLSDLRIYTKARVVYALTAAKVAGAVAQSNIYDYRRGNTPANKHSHFGVPLSAVEVKLVDNASHKTTDEHAAGEIVVSGMAVAGGETRLGVIGKSSTTLELASKGMLNVIQEHLMKIILSRTFRLAVRYSAAKVLSIDNGMIPSLFPISPFDYYLD